MNELDFSIYLKPTEIIDSDHESIQNLTKNLIGTTADPIAVSIKLFRAVRDGIRYDPYTPFYLPEHYRASNVLKRGRGFCVPKASLLCALGRACGIPSRVGFADVRNHLTTKQLADFIGTDVFVFHGFVEFYLEGKWVKATPTFNTELCQRHNVPPLEFNGREDSIFQAYNLENKKFMEYIRFHGIYADIPVKMIVEAWEKGYGKEFVQKWIKMFENGEGRAPRDFEREDVFKE